MSSSCCASSFVPVPHRVGSSKSSAPNPRNECVPGCSKWPKPWSNDAAPTKMSRGARLPRRTATCRVKSASSKRAVGGAGATGCAGLLIRLAASRLRAARRCITRSHSAGGLGSVDRRAAPPSLTPAASATSTLSGRTTRHGATSSKWRFQRRRQPCEESRQAAYAAKSCDCRTLMQMHVQQSSLATSASAAVQSAASRVAAWRLVCGIRRSKGIGLDRGF